MSVTVLQTGSPEAAVFFFAGWGMDARPFSEWRVASDASIYLVHGYGDGTEDVVGIMARYAQVRVVGWSFGVRQAFDALKRLVARHPDRLSARDGAKPIFGAVNGTLTPVHARTGLIPRAAAATLAALSPATLERFYASMCGAQRSTFTAPYVPLEALRRELAYLIESAPRALSEEDCALLAQLTVRARIGTDDRIFYARNQRAAWAEVSEMTQVDVLELAQAAHWSQTLLLDALHDATADL